MRAEGRRRRELAEGARRVALKLESRGLLKRNHQNACGYSMTFIYDSYVLFSFHVFFFLVVFNCPDHFREDKTRFGFRMCFLFTSPESVAKASCFKWGSGGGEAPSAQVSRWVWLRVAGVPPRVMSCPLSWHLFESAVCLSSLLLLCRVMPCHVLSYLLVS